VSRARLSIRDHGGETQPVSNDCRKISTRALAGAGRAARLLVRRRSLETIERRITLFPTVEWSARTTRRTLPAVPSAALAPIQKNGVREEVRSASSPRCCSSPCEAKRRRGRKARRGLLKLSEACSSRGRYVDPRADATVSAASRTTAPTALYAEAGRLRALQLQLYLPTSWAGWRVNAYAGGGDYLSSGLGDLLASVQWSPRVPAFAFPHALPSR